VIEGGCATQHDLFRRRWHATCPLNVNEVVSLNKTSPCTREVTLRHTNQASITSSQTPPHLLKLRTTRLTAEECFERCCCQRHTPRKPQPLAAHLSRQVTGARHRPLLADYCPSGARRRPIAHVPPAVATERVHMVGHVQPCKTWLAMCSHVRHGWPCAAM
jgi:hypothetical protein